MTLTVGSAMKDRLRRFWRWFLNRLPEAFLVFFLLSLVPAVVMGCAEIVRQIRLLAGNPSAYWQELAGRPWQSASVLVCLAGLVVGTVVAWRNWDVVWAVARKMILEALHRRVVLVILFFFVLLTLSMPFMLKTEGSLTSRVQLVMYYSLALAMLLLSLLAIFISAASVSSEIEHKHVHVTDTKPLQRRYFLFGKWLGVVVMCTAVLSVMTGAACILVLHMVREPDFDRMLPDEAMKARADYDNVVNEVIVARRTHRALDPPGIEQDLERRIAEMKEKGEWPDSLFEANRARDKLRMTVIAQTLTVGPGNYAGWAFRGLQPGPEDEPIAVSRPGGRIFGRWWIAELVENDEPGADENSLRPHFLGVRLPPALGWRTDVRRQFVFPASWVPKSGILYLAYENTDSEATVGFDGDLSVQLLQRGGSFLPNYYRAVLVLLCHFALLAALGIMAGAIFSFPVASLTVVFIFVVGLVGTWFSGFLDPQLFGEYTLVQEIIKLAWQGSLKGILWVMPHFAKFNPLDDLTEGQMVTWGTVTMAAAAMVVIRGGAALLIGMFVYARRELARVIV
jgi:ABC-type transport system involved in multi-copper enzyme maturation permease subunit